MERTATPGMLANPLRKNGAVRDIRRMRGMEAAAEYLGGQAALADALGIGSRLLRQKMAAERPITDAEVRLAVGALSARAAKVDDLASRLSELISDQVAL